MKNKFIDFLKGIPIGIANVIPGFSGGTMAVILNIYERFINAFSDFFHKPLKIIKDVWALVLGIIVGIIIAITLIAYLLDNFPIPTTMFFVGLIIGSIPNLYDKAKIRKIKILDVIIFFICVLVVVSLPLLNAGEIKTVEINIGSLVLIFLLAIIASATMVIPGVSGSLVLLAIGYYDVIWFDILGSFLNVLTSFDFNLIIKSIIPVIPVIIGIIFGIVLISKLIKILLKKEPQTVYYAILGLLFASPFAIIKGMYTENGAQIAESGWLSWVVGIITMILGASAVNILSKFEGENKND